MPIGFLHNGGGRLRDAQRQRPERHREDADDDRAFGSARHQCRRDEQAAQREQDRFRDDMPQRHKSHERIEGNYANVVGLPVQLVYQMLAELRGNEKAE